MDAITYGVDALTAPRPVQAESSTQLGMIPEQVLENEQRVRDAIAVVESIVVDEQLRCGRTERRGR